MGGTIYRLGILKCNASFHSFQDCVREPAFFVQDAVQVAVFWGKEAQHGPGQKGGWAVLENLGFDRQMLLPVALHMCRESEMLHPQKMTFSVTIHYSYFAHDLIIIHGI